MKDSLQAAIDIVVDCIDLLLREYLFKEVDELMELLDVEKIPTDLLFSVLTITVAAKSKLIVRDAFVERVKKVVKERGEYEDGLFHGLD